MDEQLTALFEGIIHAAPRFISDGLCAQTDPEAFFPDKGGTPRPAKDVCAQCDVRVECLQYALDNQERFGVWGGLTERERRPMLRRQERVEGAA